LTATNGTLTLGGLTGLAFTVGDGTADPTMTFSGTIANINTALNGTTYAPNMNINGAQSVNIVTDDEGNTGTGGVQSDTDNITVNITAVNDAPVNTVPAMQNMNQDTVFTFTGATQISVANVDAGGNSVQVQLTGTNGTISLSGTTGLSFVFSDGNGTGAGDGTDDVTVTFRGTLPDVNTALDNLQFTSTPGFFSGPNARLDIVTNDLGNTGTGGALQDSDFVEIFVQQVNQPPVNSVPGTQTISEDATLTFSAGNSNLISISDPDAGVAMVQVQLTVTTGALTLSSFGGLAFSVGDGTADTTMTFTGTIANINTALNGMTFFAGADVNGSSTLTIVTDDQGNTGPGGAMQDTDNVTINITAVNDAPILTSPSSVNASEDVTFNFTAGETISVTDVDSAGNTNFEANVTVTTGMLTVTPSGGAVVIGNLSNDVTIVGAVANVSTILGTLQYRGSTNFNGTDTMALTVNDNGQTGGGNLSDSDNITINVAAVNDAPVNAFPAAPQTFDEDTTLTFSTVNGNAISLSDADAAPGDNVQVTLFSAAGTMTLGNLTGLSFSFSDGNGTGAGDGTADATMLFRGTLTNVNNALQGMTFTPITNINGERTISMTSSDLGNTGSGGVQTDSDTIDLSITAVNDAPIVTVPATFNVTEDVQTAIGISVSDVDSLGGTNFQATLSVTSGLINVTPGGASITSGANDSSSLTLTGTVSNVNTAIGTMKYTGNANFNGTDTMVVNVTDNGQTGTGGTLTDGPDNITINVAAVNDKPVGLAKNFTAQGHMRINGLTGLLTGVTDPDTGTGTPPCDPTPFTVVSVTPVSCGGCSVLNLNGTTGTFDFNPGPNFTGSATLEYVVQDSGCPGNAQSDPATITITVNTPIIYFVKSVGVGTADCRLGSECTLATALDGTHIGANTGRHIFISDANTHTPGVAVTLNSGGRLKGQGVVPPVDSDGDVTDGFDDLFDIAPPAGTIARPSINLSRPTISGATTITMHNNSHVRGLNTNTSNANSLLSSGKTGLNVGDINVTSTNNTASNFAVDLGTSSGTFKFGDITANTGANGSGGARFATTTSTSTVTINNITTKAGTALNLVSTGSTAFTLNDVTSTTGSAVSVNFGAGSSTGALTFHAISANGAARGITVNSHTGSFTVNGTGTTDASGGTIQACTSKGAEFIGSNNIDLNNMNFTGNGTSQTVAGSDGTCGGNLRTGNNLSCVSNIHLQTVTTASFDNLNVTNSGQMGINGNNVNGFEILNSTVTGNGNESMENGLTFQNLSGTVTITDTIIKNNATRQIHIGNIANNTATTIGITGTRTNNAYPTMDTSTTMIGNDAPSGANTQQGILLETFAGSNISPTLNLTGVVFNNNQPQNAVDIQPLTSGTLGGTTNSCSFDTNAAGVIISMQNAASGTYDITNSEFNRSALQSILYAAANPTSGTLQGTIQSNTIGTAGQSGSACFPTSGCNGHGIDVNFIGGSGAIRLKIGGTGGGQGNTIQQFDGNGIKIVANGTGTPSVHATIQNNAILNPLGLVAHGIDTNIGTTAGANVFGCFNISGNSITGTYQDPGVGTQFGIHTRVRFLSEHRLPGMTGTGAANAVTFLTTQNPGAAGKIFSEGAGVPGYQSGAACTTP